MTRSECMSAQERLREKTAALRRQGRIQREPTESLRP